MNTENTGNQDVANAVLEYQELAKEDGRKLRKYLKAQAVMDITREEWEAAQEAANKAITALKEALK